MTRTVGVHEAKTHLSRLLDDVANGHEVVITRRGEEVARLVAPRRKVPRLLGVDRGRFLVPDGFDAPLPADVLDEFES
jgi:prevent-host-death family protein